MFPVDPPLHGANPNNAPMMDNVPLPWPAFPPGFPTAQAPVPMGVHVHGAEVVASSDGHPDSWWTANNPKGSGYNAVVPGLTDAAVFEYTSTQEPGTIWYLDHACTVIPAPGPVPEHSTFPPPSTARGIITGPVHAPPITMEAIDAIMTRRSVRRFSSETVDDATVVALLRAAMQAPSAANEQPWTFVVIDDRAALDAIPSFSPYASWARGAPLGVLVCADTRSLPFPNFWVQDCSAAIENLLLAAHALGLGAVWTGCYPLEDRVAGFVRHCRLPDGVVPVGFVVLGHPSEVPPPQDRYRADRVHRNTWGA